MVVSTPTSPWRTGTVLYVTFGQRSPLGQRVHQPQHLRGKQVTYRMLPMVNDHHVRNDCINPSISMENSYVTFSQCFFFLQLLTIWAWATSASTLTSSSFYFVINANNLGNDFINSTGVSQCSCWSMPSIWAISLATLAIFVENSYVNFSHFC
jgi:hypothetical protein